MYVGRIMNRELVTVPPEMTLSDARTLIDTKGIEHLLIVDGSGELVGVVSDRDLRQHSASSAISLSSHELNYLLSQVTMESVMQKKVVTVTPDTTIERAALIIKEKRIGSLPVKEGGVLVGIITRTDVLSVLLNAIGMSDDSGRFQVVIKDRLGALAEITHALATVQINIQSLMCWPVSEYPGTYQLTIRVASTDLDMAVRHLESRNFKVMADYVEDFGPFITQ